MCPGAAAASELYSHPWLGEKTQNLSSTEQRDGEQKGNKPLRRLWLGHGESFPWERISPGKSDLAKLSVEKNVERRQSLHLNKPNLTSGILHNCCKKSPAAGTSHPHRAVLGLPVCQTSHPVHGEGHLGKTGCRHTTWSSPLPSGLVTKTTVPGI